MSGLRTLTHASPPSSWTSTTKSLLCRSGVGSARRRGRSEPDGPGGLGHLRCDARRWGRRVGRCAPPFAPIAEHRSEDGQVTPGRRAPICHAVSLSQPPNGTTRTWLSTSNSRVATRASAFATRTCGPLTLWVRVGARGESRKWLRRCGQQRRCDQLVTGSVGVVAIGSQQGCGVDGAVSLKGRVQTHAGGARLPCSVADLGALSVGECITPALEGRAVFGGANVSVLEHVPVVRHENRRGMIWLGGPRSVHDQPHVVSDAVNQRRVAGRRTASRLL